MQARQKTPDRQSRQSNQMMSPLQANAGKIIRGQDGDLASSYAASRVGSKDQVSQSAASRISSKAYSKAQAAANEQAEYQEMNDEIAMNKALHLVPCRWERSGWRYVEADPSKTNFFKNPNRVNSFGVGADFNKHRRYGSQMRGGAASFYLTSNKSAFGQGIPANQTTYGQNFIS